MCIVLEQFPGHDDAKAYGPFATGDEATHWATTTLRHRYWYWVDLHPATPDPAEQEY